MTGDCGEFSCTITVVSASANGAKKAEAGLRW